MSAQVVRAEILDTPAPVDQLRAEVTHPKAGAVVTFHGVVRDHDHGTAVTAIDYTAHPSATDVLVEIATEIAAREGVHALGVVHRVGHLVVGDIAMVVNIAAEHRGQAFSATSDLVDEIKKRLPVWKKQALADGGHEWTGLPT